MILPLVQDTKSYLGCTVEGVARWFGEKTMIAFEVTDGITRMTLLARVAAVRGFGA